MRGVLDVLHRCLGSICNSNSSANDSRASLNQSTPGASYKESLLADCAKIAARAFAVQRHWRNHYLVDGVRTHAIVCVCVCLPAGLVTFSFATFLPAIKTNISRAHFAGFIRCRFSLRAEWRVLHFCFVALLPLLPSACPSCRRERSWWSARLASSRQSTPMGWWTRSGWRSATDAGLSWH